MPVAFATGNRGFERSYFLGAPFDDLTFNQVLDLLRASDPSRPFGYIVTPNVDHVVRLEQHKHLDELYSGAWLSLCDSRPIYFLSKLRPQKLNHITGSDLSGALFERVIERGENVALIAANDKIVDEMRRHFPHVNFNAHIPPSNVAGNPEAFAACVDFAASSGCRFVLIGVGAPQSEKIAFEASKRPGARGIALCIGASLEFLAGEKKRAPVWMRKVGVEWVYRLSSEPKRLWRRYVYAFVPFGRLVLEEWRRKPSRQSSR